MLTLAEKLTTTETRPKVLRACADLLEAEVASQRGLTGTAIKAAFMVVKAVRPGIIDEVLERLLPEFASALEPLHARAMEAAEHNQRPPSEQFAQQLRSCDEEAADLLLSVTDRRAENANNGTLKKTYAKLRSGAKQHVKNAVPQVARTLAPFV